MPNSMKRSLDNITRDDIRRVCTKYRNDKPKLRRILRTLFAKPSNITLFGWFVSESYISLETPAFHREMTDMASDENNKYVAFAAPRGHAKSTTIGFTYAMWSTVYQKHHFGVIISDTVTQSIEFVNALKDQLENNIKLRWLYGDLKSDDWRDGDFVTTTNIRWVAKGAGMKVRGIRHREYRPDLMIFDDLENDERVATAEQRKKLKNWLTKAALPALSRDGRAVLVGTILHHDSLLQNILKHKEMFASWKTKLYRAIMTDAKGEEHALWPEHMDLATLKAMRDDPKHPRYIGSIAFAQEYQNKPLDEGDMIVSPEQIQWAERRPDAARVVTRVMAVDPAVSERQSADPTGIVVGELTAEGDVYIFYVSNKKLSPSKNATHINNIYEIYQPNAVGMEKGALELVFRDLLAGLPILPQKPDADKVRRLLAVSKFFEAGRVYFVQNGRGVQDLYDQLMEFPNGSHDDMVDAMVYVLRMLLVDGISNDEDFDEAGSYAHRDDEGVDEWGDELVDIDD